MKKIKLTKGQVALIDNEDYNIVALYKWHCSTSKGKHYARCSNCRLKVIGTKSMHRLIMGITDPKILVDHRDGNGLNNRKINLRVCSHAQNVYNTSKYYNKETTSKYIGVCKNRSRVKGQYYTYWAATIRVNGKTKRLGLFPFTETGEILAAIVRDEAVLSMYGEFAHLNFPSNEK